jgi:penicillin-binding protein 1B
MDRKLRRRILGYSFMTVSLALLVAVLYGFYLSWQVTREFASRSWDRPAQVYAAPLELYGGRRISQQDLVAELGRLGYRETDGTPASGRFRRNRDSIELHTRSFDYAGQRTPEQFASIRFTGNRIAAISSREGSPVAIMQLDPFLIGSIFPAHGEDRIVITPEETPEIVKAALIAVEDRRFESHIGIDLRAILRAATVNISSGQIEQGASTLTQQLVRSFYLSTERTYRRKISEAFMAMSLELRYEKEDLLQAYINEVYLGQDGARAIHGFGLASQFYFSKPLAELDVHEVALLVAVVRGPSYYDPYRNPERALARRNLVLELMAGQEVIPIEQMTASSALPLDIVDRRSGSGSYYAGFLELVRTQLARDYAREDLEVEGLRVYTTLDPTIQSLAETALAKSIDRLQPDRPPLDGAVIVTSPHSGEIRALVGSRLTRFDGFNRALNARRPLGSIVKPVVYLAALESGRYSLASLVEDEPIRIELDNGTIWAPTNFDGESMGTVPAIRALVESLNQATVRLGLDVGLPAVIDLLGRLGLENLPAPYPSMLLGAFDLSPFEVTQLYNTLANGGFRTPLRSVRSVVDSTGATIQRYPLAIEQTVDPRYVYEINQALSQVMRLGTGRAAASLLPANLVTAGKTGTSDGYRDSWFAGFSNDHLVVTWMGNDANEMTGLTGSAGAGLVWSEIMSKLDTRPYAVNPPEGYRPTWIDYRTGLETDRDCPQALPLLLEGRDRPPRATECGGTRIGFGSRIRTWMQGSGQ